MLWFETSGPSRYGDSAEGDRRFEGDLKPSSSRLPLVRHARRPARAQASVYAHPGRRTARVEVIVLGLSNRL
jgi:hypothetical protein